MSLANLAQLSLVYNLFLPSWNLPRDFVFLVKNVGLDFVVFDFRDLSYNNLSGPLPKFPSKTFK